MKRIILFTILACSLFLNAAYAQVPDLRHVVKSVYDTGQFVLTTQEGAGVFTDAVERALHRVDADFGHLKKPENRTHCGIPFRACDVVLYKKTGQIVDIIKGAGDPDAEPTWGPGRVGEYTAADWFHIDLDTPTPTPEDPAPPQPPPSVDLTPILKALADQREQTERIFANVTAQNQALAATLAAIETRLIRHDEEPMFITKLLKNRYVQVIGAAILARYGLPAFD